MLQVSYNMKSQYLLLDYYEVNEFRMELEIDKNYKLTVAIYYFSNEILNWNLLERYDLKDFLLNVEYWQKHPHIGKQQYAIFKNKLLDILIEHYK